MCHLIDVHVVLVKLDGCGMRVIGLGNRQNNITVIFKMNSTFYMNLTKLVHLLVKSTYSLHVSQI